MAQPASPDPDPDPGIAYVWRAWRQDASARHAGLLDETERERWSAYRLDADRHRFQVGCALSKTVIAALTGQRPADVSFDRTCRQCGKPHGKPVLRGGGPEHSVTHSGDLVVVAAAANPVGVDVEQAEDRARPLGGGGDPESLARLVLAEPERAALASLPPELRARAFLVAWTRKEAVTKATGDGLQASFTEVVLSVPPAPARVIAWPYPQDPGQVSLFDIDVAAGYVSALAVLGPCAGVLVEDGSALLSA